MRPWDEGRDRNTLGFPPERTPQNGDVDKP